jgi:hypothetical protein
MIELLTWISIISGAILIILLLLSLLGGLELDVDLGADTDVDVDTGNIGIVKGLLTFLSVGSWVVKLVLAVDQNPIVAFGGGLVAGLVAVFLLNALLRFFLNNQADVNWSNDDALYKEGKVYLKIPANDGQGIVQVQVKGAVRELKAKTNSDEEIPTGTIVLVEDVIDDIAIVSTK